MILLLAPPTLNQWVERHWFLQANSSEPTPFADTEPRRVNRPKMRLPILPDQLRPGLRLIICGTAVGAASARKGAYYAGPGNKFWTTLHSIGLTTRELLPQEYVLLSEDGIGLTDLAKNVAGADAELRAGCFDAQRLQYKIKELQPRAVAFNGREPRPSSSVYGRQR